MDYHWKFAKLLQYYEFFALTFHTTNRNAFCTLLQTFSSLMHEMPHKPDTEVREQLLKHMLFGTVLLLLHWVTHFSDTSLFPS